MKINILKFKTDTGIPLIFDNYSGIVIYQEKYTDHILNNIEKDKESVIEKLQTDRNFDIDEFEREYNYIGALVNAGYFNDTHFNKAQNNKAMGIYEGIASHLILITTEDCNLRCKYCVYSDFYKDKKTYSSKKMTLDTAIKSVDMFRKYHAEKIRRGYSRRAKVNFYGGEPLLNYRMIKSIVEYINTTELEDVEYMITTNGTRLNDEIIDFFARNRFLVAFSLDGDEFNHNRNRVTISGGKTHEIIVNNIVKYYKALKKYNNEDQIINIACCYDNYSDMEKVVDFFEELRMTVPVLNVLYNKVYDVDTEYYDYCDEIYKDSDIKSDFHKTSIRRLFEKYYQNEKVKDAPNSVKSIFTSYYLLKNRKKGCLNLYQGNSCVIGDKLCVSPDGRIYICEKANQQLCIGDVDAGLNPRKMEEVYNKLYQIKREHCINCTVSRLCDVCFAHFIKNDDLLFNEEFCRKRKESYKRALEFVYTKMSENKEIFDLADG